MLLMSFRPPYHQEVLIYEKLLVYLTEVARKGMTLEAD